MSAVDWRTTEFAAKEESPLVAGSAEPVEVEAVAAVTPAAKAEEVVVVVIAFVVAAAVQVQELNFERLLDSVESCRKVLSCFVLCSLQKLQLL